MKNKLIPTIRTNPTESYNWLLLLCIAILFIVYFLDKEDKTREYATHDIEAHDIEAHNIEAPDIETFNNIQPAEEVIKSREDIAEPSVGEVLYNCHSTTDNAVSGCSQDNPDVDRNIYSRWPYIEWENIDKTCQRRSKSLNY